MELFFREKKYQRLRWQLSTVLAKSFLLSKNLIQYTPIYPEQQILKTFNEIV
jgi:hypothetical protein